MDKDRHAINKKEREAFAREAAKTIQTESDLNDFRQMLTNVTIETALNAGLNDHLGYDKHEKTPAANIAAISRNGYSSKTLRTEDGEFEVDTPRDRKGSLEPRRVKSISLASPRWPTNS